MNVLTKVLVGSRLHGLATPDSDYDYRGIHINPLKDILSPFKNPKATSWIEGEVDNTSYELVDFCKHAVHGNVTILEVFFSNRIEKTTPLIEELRKNWRWFIDTERFVMASRGYAANQYNKMRLFEPDKRTPKFAVAYLRVLWQCAEFLETGEFKCQIEEPLKSYLMEVKNNFNPSMVPVLTEKFQLMQQRISDTWPEAHKNKPDIKKIEDFILKAYTI